MSLTIALGPSVQSCHMEWGGTTALPPFPFGLGANTYNSFFLSQSFEIK